MSRLSDEWHSDSDSDAFFPVRRCSAFCASLCSATRILCTCKSYGAVFFLHQILHISSIHWYRWCWTIRCDTIKTKVYTVLDVFWFLDVYLLSFVACIMSVVDTDPQNSILHKAQMTSSAQSPGHRISLQWHPSYENLICHGNLLRTIVSEKASWIYYTWYTCVILYSCRLWNSYMLAVDTTPVRHRSLYSDYNFRKLLKFGVSRRTSNKKPNDKSVTVCALSWSI